MEPWSFEPKGRFEEHTWRAGPCRGTPLGDPHERPLWVYLPPGYDDDPNKRYPSVYAIQGLTGQLDMWRNRSPFRRNFPELADDLFARGDAPPVIVVWVDCWTSLGGSQFLDSPGTGNYLTYLCDEVVPFVDERYRTIADRDHRGIGGKSSGGYGAMVVPMLRPDLWGGLATHAGDALFEMCYLPEFRESVRVLRDEYEGSFDTFWKDFRSRPGVLEGERRAPAERLVHGGVLLDRPGRDGPTCPFDTVTGELIPDVWERWLAARPVRMVPEHADTLRSMRAIYIDAGKKDEYFLDLGAEAFRRELEAIGVTDVFFELFDGTHMAIEYRYPLSLKYLAERLSA